MMVPSLALRNIPPTSDSVAEYMTFLMMVEMVWTAPLLEVESCEVLGIHLVSWVLLIGRSISLA